MYLLEQQIYDVIEGDSNNEIILISESERLCKEIAEERFWKHLETDFIGEDCIVNYYVYKYESGVLFGKLTTERLVVEDICNKRIKWENI